MELDEAQAARRDEILDAAMELLAGGGPAALTTAALAREARCSKQTLYALFDDRDAILAALIERQLEMAEAPAEVSAGVSPRAGLEELGAAWLERLTADATVSLHRAALSDPSGELSQVLTANKDPMVRRIRRQVDALRAAGLMGFDDSAEVARVFYGLLVGDRQIQALHGGKDGQPKRKKREKQAAQAVRRLLRVFPPKGEND